MSDWLIYWRPATFLNALIDDSPIDHTASNQYKRIAVGDTLWVVGSPKSRNMILIGKQRVDRVVDQDKAEAITGEMLWEADYHAMTEKPLPKVCIPMESKFIESLRFIGNSKRLPPNFSGCHLQTMRRLSPESVKALSGLWENRKKLDRKKLVRTFLLAERADLAVGALTIN
jgi:hypothetical protein